MTRSTIIGCLPDRQPVLRVAGRAAHVVRPAHVIPGACKQAAMTARNTQRDGQPHRAAARYRNSAGRGVDVPMIEDMPGLVRAPEIAELRAFCCAVERGSLGSAALMLRVTQPAISKRLRTIEGLLGVKLLERSSRGVVATAAGERLYPHARKLLAQADALGDLVSANDHEAPIRLAASHTIAEFVLPGRLAGFERDAGHLSLEMVIANSNVVRQLVGSGRVELGLAAVDPADPGELHCEPLLDDEVVVGVPHTHHWARLPEVPLHDFLHQPMIMRDPDASTRRTVAQVLAEHDLTLAEPLIEVASTSAARRAALERSGPLLLSSLAVESDSRFASRRVSGLRFARTLALFSSPEKRLSPAARELAGHLTQVAGH